MDEHVPDLLSERAPEATRSVTARAERALKGQFDLLGYRGLSFGDPVDWQSDPLACRRASLVHWSRLNPLDHTVLGDSKVVWELNRHQWLVDLALAYRLTGDERYAQASTAHITDWLSSNPVGRGINWASSLEVAFRLVAWCWTLVLLRGSSALRPDVFACMRASIEDHASHVERYLSEYFSPNTHLTGEALGLFYAGTVFPDVRRARHWRRQGARILVDEITRQVFPDGVYFEQSTCYQRYTAEIFLHFLILCRRSRVATPPAVTERLQAMLDFLLSVRSPDGGSPSIGDADGGWLLPLAHRAPDDLTGVFATAAAVFGRADYAWAAGRTVPEVLWLLGRPGLDAFDALRPEPPAGARSRLFKDGGYVVMGDSWNSLGHHLIFDVGPLGCPVSGGHGHADLLSIQCSAFGQRFVVDPGTGTYGDDRWRDFFRSTAAHSTVEVDGGSQAAPRGPFAWRERPSARLRSWVSTDAFDRADADHDAYRRLPDPVRHRRQVLFVKPRFWLLLDELDGADVHTIDLRFQFGAVEVTLQSELWARATGSGHALLVRPFCTAPLRVTLFRGCNEPMGGWVSPDYGQREPAPAVVYSAVTKLPLRILTLLLPIEDAAGAPPAVRPLVSEQGELLGVAFGDDEEFVELVGPAGVMVHRRSDGGHRGGH